MAESSANNRTFDLVLSGRSFMEIRKRMGPRTEPCGTPDVTGTVADFSLSITTVRVWSGKNAWIHLRVGPLMPYLWSLSSYFWWLILSNAFEKSSKTRSVWLPLWSSASSLLWVSQDRLLRKPCWRSYSKLYLSMLETMFLVITCSSTLHRILVNQIGL